MADVVALPDVPADLSVSEPVRHSAVVRATHWIHTICVVALVVSGVAILIAHPRLYWGETGGVGVPSLVDLPLPFVFGPSGWGRSLHFLAAWIAVLNGVLYVASGIVDRHFRRDFLPARSDITPASLRRVMFTHLRLARLRDEPPDSYNVVQRLTYLAVVFVVFPLIVLTGLAMSPALTSVMPVLVIAWGGQQSARTMHFVFAIALVLFVVVHVVMIGVTGFAARMRGMNAGSRTTARMIG